MSGVCPIATWCENDNPAHISEDAHGFTFDAVAEDSRVNVLVHHYDREDGVDVEDEWAINIDIGPWVISASSTADLKPELDREFDNLRSIVNQIERRLRAFHREHLEVDGDA